MLRTQPYAARNERENTHVDTAPSYTALGCCATCAGYVLLRTFLRFLLAYFSRVICVACVEKYVASDKNQVQSQTPLLRSVADLLIDNKSLVVYRQNRETVI